MEVQASAAKTADGNSVDFTTPATPPIKGIMLFLEITAATGTTPTLDLDVEVKDPVSGKYFVVASFAQKTAAGTDRLSIYPSLTAVANKAISDLLPTTWRLKWTIGGGSPSFTFSVGGRYLR